jgi:hypothetical protein
MVQPELRNEVAGKPDPRAARNAAVARHRQEQHGEVAATADQPPRGIPRQPQRAALQLRQTGEHRLGIAAVDLAQSVRGNAMLQRSVDSVMDDKPVSGAPQLIHDRRDILQQRRAPARVGNGALGAVPVEIPLDGHRDPSSTTPTPAGTIESRPCSSWI